MLDNILEISYIKNSDLFTFFYDLYRYAITEKYFSFSLFVSFGNCMKLIAQKITNSLQSLLKNLNFTSRVIPANKLNLTSHFATKQQKKLTNNDVSRAVYLFGIKLNGQIVKMWMRK